MLAVPGTVTFGRRLHDDGAEATRLGLGEFAADHHVKHLGTSKASRSHQTGCLLCARAKMSLPEHISPLACLLEYVSSEVRDAAVQSMVTSLAPLDVAGGQYIAALIVQHGFADARAAFMSYLHDLIRQGHVNTAVSISLRCPQLGEEVFKGASEIASQTLVAARQSSEVETALPYYLSFATSTISHLPVKSSHSILLSQALELLITAGETVAARCKDLVLAVLTIESTDVYKITIEPSERLLWRTIEKLVTWTTRDFHTLYGYTIWLRWISSAQVLIGLINTTYWRLLQNGLRHGDLEQRKICLDIIRLTSASKYSEIPQDLRLQYHRYCTVFEIIVLGRYINQIQECESDLDSLKSDSGLRPQWLYTLLASGLDPRMQDSNRKFIGTWIMRSDLTPTHEFLEFLKHDFLRWATIGQLFVSTLHVRDGEMHCDHGDRVSAFLGTALKHEEHHEQVIDTVIDRINRKGSSTFAYAVVYLLHGLGRHVLAGRAIDISCLSSLPQVARDFVSLTISDERYTPAQDLLASRRSMREREAIEKCRSFDPSHGSLEDLWTQMDLLEYPKSLLTVMPAAILQPRMIEQAMTDSVLAQDLAAKLMALQHIAETKVYLFSPLMNALRSALAIDAAAMEALQADELIVRVTECQPRPAIDLMLEEATINIAGFKYEQYFGERPSYGFATFVDLVSRLQSSQVVISRVLHQLLEKWKDQKVPPLIVSPWKRTLQLQTLLLCFEQYSPESADEIEHLLEDLFYILAIEPLSRYRYLLEWIVVRLFMRYGLEHILLTRLATRDHHSNPKHLASLTRIATILACSHRSDENLALQLAPSFVPLAASSKVVIRHEAQWQIPLLMDHARAMGWELVTTNSVLLALDHYIRDQERFHEPPTERQIGRFDPEAHHTLSNLVEGAWFGLDHIEKPLTSRDDFVKLYERDTDSPLPASCMPLGNPVKRTPVPTENGQSEKVTPPTKFQTSNGPSALQTKGTAYLANTLSDPSTKQARTNNIIVVGSLVENPYNLGGLSRVSEIFGAEALHVQNPNVTSNKDFTSVSVSSHLHFPIEQLSIADIPAFLARKKADGFTVVGIEQTDRSVILGSEQTKLPEKVVLVVGSEREGIPALVLTACDLLLEIPQRGITRSLNVQTAVSIVLYEYDRQHRSGV